MSLQRNGEPEEAMKNEGKERVTEEGGRGGGAEGGGGELAEGGRGRGETESYGDSGSVGSMPCEFDINSHEVNKALKDKISSSGRTRLPTCWAEKRLSLRLLIMPESLNIAHLTGTLHFSAALCNFLFFCLDISLCLSRLSLSLSLQLCVVFSSSV